MPKPNRLPLLPELPLFSLFSSLFIVVDLVQVDYLVHCGFLLNVWDTYQSRFSSCPAIPDLAPARGPCKPVWWSWGHPEDSRDRRLWAASAPPRDIYLQWRLSLAVRFLHVGWDRRWHAIYNLQFDIVCVQYPGNLYIRVFKDISMQMWCTRLGYILGTH